MYGGVVSWCFQVMQDAAAEAVFCCMQGMMFYDVPMSRRSRKRGGKIPVVRSKSEAGFVWLGFAVMLAVFLFIMSLGVSFWEAYSVCWTLEWFGLPYALAVYVRSAYEGKTRPSFAAMVFFPWSAAFLFWVNDDLEPEPDDRCYGEGEGNGKVMASSMFAGVLLGWVLVGWPVAVLPWLWLWW